MIFNSPHVLKSSYKISKTWVISCAVIYPIVWLCLGVGDLIKQLNLGDWEDVYNEFYWPLPGYCMIIGDCINDTRTDITLGVMVLIGVPFIMPIIIMLMCSLIQRFSLSDHASTTNTNHSSAHGSRDTYRPITLDERTDKVEKQQHITITVYLISMVCIICNSVYVAFCFLDLFTELLREWSTPTPLITVAYTLSTTIPLINATITPLVLITRESAMKRHVMGCGRYIIETITPRKQASTSIRLNDIEEYEEQPGPSRLTR